MKSWYRYLSLSILLIVMVSLTACGGLARVPVRSASQAADTVVKEAPGIVDDISKQVADDVVKQGDGLAKQIADEAVEQGIRVLSPEEQTELLAKMPEIDKLIDESNHNEAIALLTRYKADYGEQPDIMWRLGMVEISEGNLEEAKKLITKAPVAEIPDAKPFFATINNLIDDATDSKVKHNIRTGAEALDWKHQQAQGIVPQGSVTGVIADDDVLFLAHKIVSFATSEVSESSPEEIAESSLPVYIQSTPGLNEIDWSIGIDKALNQFPEGELPPVIRVTEEGIAGYQPHLVLVGNERYILRSPRTPRLPPGTPRTAGQGIFLISEGGSSNQSGD